MTKTALISAAGAMALAMGAPIFEAKGASFETRGAGDPPDVATAIDQINRVFEEFKSANDKRLADIEKKGVADILTSEQVDKINSELTRLSDLATELQKKAARPVVGAGTQLSVEAEEHKKAFNAYLRKGEDNGLHAIEAKAISVGTPADGGYALPEEIDRTIVDLMIDISPLRGIANVVRVGTPDWKKLVNVHGASSGWVGETAARPATNTPQLSEVTFPMGEIYANPQATQQSLEDLFFDVEAWLAAEVSTEFAYREGLAFISGDGTNKPKGFLAGTTPVSTADGARAFGTLQYIASGQAAALPTSTDIFLDVVYALKAGYRANARWVMSKALLAAVRKYKDTTNNYLWQPSLQVGQPDSFLGYPVTEAEGMPGVGAGNFPIAFGDFKRGYTIVDRAVAGVKLRDPFTNKPYVGFYTTKRVGGNLVDTEALKLLKIAAS